MGHPIFFDPPRINEIPILYAQKVFYNGKTLEQWMNERKAAYDVVSEYGYRLKNEGKTKEEMIRNISGCVSSTMIYPEAMRQAVQNGDIRNMKRHIKMRLTISNPLASRNFTISTTPHGSSNYQRRSPAFILPFPERQRPSKI